jgi:hypothetical protein
MPSGEDASSFGAASAAPPPRTTEVVGRDILGTSERKEARCELIFLKWYYKRNYAIFNLQSLAFSKTDTGGAFGVGPQ